ncbi:MAG: DUF3848 domain-containing protein [Clostridia bacterium]
MNVREELYSKMEKEYNLFIENLKQLSPEKIMDNAYEKVMKEELVSMFYPEYEKYDISDIKALNKCEKPLEELYQGWMDFDGGIHELLEYSIDDTIETLKREQKEKNKSMER